MPVSWTELKTLESADLFTLPEALKYLKKRKKDPWADYLSTRQDVKILKPIKD